jgi:hypothetical protein
MRYSFEIEGINVNPDLPEDFDYTPHDERDRAEIEKWWGNPYIIITELHIESWVEHYHRLKNECGWSDEKIGTQKEYEIQCQEQRKNWLEAFPTGFRFDVRCLDGGAWDRSTNRGSYASFEEALEVAKSYIGYSV